MKCPYLLFMRLVNRLVMALENRNLPNYFAPGCNLLDGVSSSEIEKALLCLRDMLGDPVGTMMSATSKPHELYGYKEGFQMRDKLLSMFRDVEQNANTEKYLQSLALLRGHLFVLDLYRQKRYGEMRRRDQSIWTWVKRSVVDHRLSFKSLVGILDGHTHETYLRNIDKRVESKLLDIIKSSNEDLVEHINFLRSEVKTMRANLQQRDGEVKELQSEVRKLQEKNNELEQYGRRWSLRISGVQAIEENTTEAVVKYANETLKVDPPLQKVDTDVRRRLPKPQTAGPDEPWTVMVRLRSPLEPHPCTGTKWLQREWYWNHNKDNAGNFFMNEDCTARSAILFPKMRVLPKKKFVK